MITAHAHYDVMIRILISHICQNGRTKAEEINFRELSGYQINDGKYNGDINYPIVEATGSTPPVSRITFRIRTRHTEIQ
jgi:hypothetical protein